MYGSCVVQEGANRARTYFERVITLTQEVNELLYRLIQEYTQRGNPFSVREFRDEIAHSLDRDPSGIRIHFGPGEEGIPLIKRLTLCYDLQFLMNDCNPPLRVTENVEYPDESDQVTLPDIRNFV